MIYTGYSQKGDGIGKEIGFPTINLTIKNPPPEGVYLVEILNALDPSEKNRKSPKDSAVKKDSARSVFLGLDPGIQTSSTKKNIFALCHSGFRPTIKEKKWRTELHVLQKNITNIPEKTSVSFSLLTKIREVQSFSSLEELKEQIEKDKKKAEEWIIKKKKTS